MAAVIVVKRQVLVRSAISLGVLLAIVALGYLAADRELVSVGLFTVLFGGIGWVMLFPAWVFQPWDRSVSPGPPGEVIVLPEHRGGGAQGRPAAEFTPEQEPPVAAA
ncbi:hypothetical protein [Pengzhenrongella sp.]|jgi:hypothetical protein|uniref:hypothetical protein n=1 Tax=Pengzhenrongella sp. TaxID=2888820 RepID=UPI002F9549D7